MSRGSQRSLMTGDRGNGGRSGSMKCIVTVGIILPLLAAIIGVAAWTLTNEKLHSRSQPTSVHLGGHSSYRSADHIFEERNDDIEFGQKLPIGAAVNKDVIGSPLEEERDILPPSPEEQSNRDPLYVVHYVPQGKDAAPETPKPPKQDGSDVLSKILSAGKGTGKGTPQFVVFAPSPEEEDAEDEDDSARVARKRVKKKKKARKDVVEYDDDEYVENSQLKPKVAAPRPRHGDFESSEYQNNHHQPHHFSHQPHYYNNHNQQQHMPCCAQPMMTTAAPGLTIQMGQGLPMSPLGMLRQLLRPKVDLRKKLFFGIQLENGMGFGGEQPAAPAQPAQGGGGMMPAGGGMGQHQGQGQHQGMGGGMYRFG